MKHSYTVLLAIMLAVIAISVFFPRYQFVEGLDIEDSKKSDDHNEEHEDDGDEEEEEEMGKHVDSKVAASDSMPQHTVYKSEDDCPDNVCLWKNKQKDNMDLVKAGNSVEDHDTTETFANWNPSW